MTWIDQLWDLLCKIYEEFDGDRANLGDPPAQDPAAALDDLNAELDAQGVPPGFDMTLIDDLEAKLAESGNSLSPQLNGRYAIFIADMREAAG